MANRYWVGGAGNWSSTAKWSTTSGGASGASVPTSADIAIFDANSGGKFISTVDVARTVGGIQITPSATVGQLTISLTAPLTTGSLTTTGTAGNNRVFFTSTTYGIAINFVITGAVSISDCDFRGINVTGASSPISGTRIGNRGESQGITFSAAKTVYWNLAGAQNWSANGWAATPTGFPSTDYFPLPQDTATFTNAGSVTGTITLGTVFSWVSTIDMSGRTSAMTLSVGAITAYGSWKTGSGVSFTGWSSLVFQGGNNHTLLTAGKTTGSIYLQSYGGSLTLLGSLTVSVPNHLYIDQGTFNTGGYALSLYDFISQGTSVRTINLGASAITLSSGVPWNVTSTGLTINPGTSQINGNLNTTFNGAGLNYNILAFNGGSNYNNYNITGQNTFGEIRLIVSYDPSVTTINFADNQTVGTLTCSGSSPTCRIWLLSNTLGTQRTLTVNSLSATDCDFRDIVIAGAAAGSSPTRAGDCGNNSGITFPAAKTVYWNLAGTQAWSAVGWATSSGGSPNVNNFPLAQDTAVINDAGSAGTIQMSQRWNVGTIDASTRTLAVTFSTSLLGYAIYGDLKLGSGMTVTATTLQTLFSKPGTQTIICNGVSYNNNVTCLHPLGTVQLGDALVMDATNTLSVSAGTFDAVNYNVTVGLCSVAASQTLKMGSGTWTLSGTGTVWSVPSTAILYAGTSTVVLSNNTTASRSFTSDDKYYNKLTIGGATSTSTTTFTSSLNGNYFGELASTKTVAHTIAFGTVPQYFAKWTITGTLGNVVTLTGTSITLIGPAVTGIDYLAMGTLTVTGAGEFYAGVNSTGTAAAPVYRTAAPAPRTLYWVGGSGNWSSTTKWSTSSGGASGAAIPTSLDNVIFDSASSATGYTVTIDLTIIRCANFTMGPPASGAVTISGGSQINFHGNVSFSATTTIGIGGAIYLIGSNGGSYTFAANSSMASYNASILVYGVGATWTLGSAISLVNSTTAGFLYVAVGTLNTNGYSIVASKFITYPQYLSTTNLGASAISLQSTTISNALDFTNSSSTGILVNNKFNAGTSTIALYANSSTMYPGDATFYNFTWAGTTNLSLSGNPTFNGTLNIASSSTIGVRSIFIYRNLTINTLTLNAATTAACRTFIRSTSAGTQYTLSVGALTAGAADFDFRDIAITGAASPISGTRFGDAKGNSGITFSAAKTVYYALSVGGNWGVAGSGAWALTNGGAADSTAFPLAQDTAVFPANYPLNAQVVTINASYVIGTIDMSARVAGTQTMTLATTSNDVLGNWINGGGAGMSGLSTLAFRGRGSQTIRTSGVSFTQSINIDSIGGTVTLQDAFFSAYGGLTALYLSAGTFNTANYNVSLYNAASGLYISGNFPKTLAIGSSTVTISGSNGFSSGTNTTITGTGTISLTSASAKTFAGGGNSYSGITVNQGGAGQLNITGNNTFKDITNTYSTVGATTISLGNTTTALTQFTGTGAAAKLLTLNGTSAATAATLVLSSGAVTASDYLNISNVRAYSLSSTWYAGANSTNSGSLGWIFSAYAPPVATNYGGFFVFFS